MEIEKKYANQRKNRKSRSDTVGDTGSEPEITFLSGGTDGQDGPCPVAGAWTKLEKEKILDSNFCSALEENDSFNYLMTHRPDQLIKTGLTYTNVMDIHIIQFHPQS